MKTRKITQRERSMIGRARSRSAGEAYEDEQGHAGKSKGTVITLPTIKFLEGPDPETYGELK